MNYLAHLFLSAGEPELMIGNFVADTVKGSRYREFPGRIAEGIMMHRSTDFFSDTHPVYLKSVHRLNLKHGKYSGVITDMLYDHLLAISFETISGEKLTKFSKSTYQILESFKDQLPEKNRAILYYMKKHDWLVSYASINGLERALSGLSKRIKYYYPLETAIKDFIEKRNDFEADFREFFPLLFEHVKPYLKAK